MIFKPRGVTSDDPRYAGNSRIMTIPDFLSYRDTWRERLTEEFSLARILQAARAEKNRAMMPEKLVMTSNGFKVKDREAIDESERGVRMVQSTLNKLTESNFDVIAKSILIPEIILNTRVVGDVVRLIYDKALVEPVFAGLYARLCVMIVRYEYEYHSMRGGEVDAQKSDVRVAIVDKCQRMFDGAAKAVQKTATEEEAEKLRKRNVNNIKFAGELFLKSLITQKIIDLILDEKLYNNTPNDMDLEVVVNLLEVVGKMYEEKHREAQPRLWKTLATLQEDRRFSNRIRFLLQNLIDRRNGGWKPREPEKVVVEEPPKQSQQQSHQQHHHPNQQQQQSQQPQQSQQHYHYHNNQQQHHHHHRNNEHPSQQMGRKSVSYQDVSASYGVGTRRATSYSDLAGNNACGVPPPPPFPSSSPEDHLSPEEQRQIALARPPETLTEKVRRKILCIARDAVEEGFTRPGEMTGELSRVLGPNESDSQSAMASVYVILMRSIMDTKEDERTLFSTALIKGKWERSILARGLAWCLTKIIEEREVTDHVRIYSRYVDVVMRIPELNFLCVVRDVMARTANYLEALMAVCECTEEWEEDFIRVWDLLVAKQRALKQRLGVGELMEALNHARLGSFMRNVLPDVVATMTQAGLFTEDELRGWRAEHAENSKLRTLVEELAKLYP